MACGRPVIAFAAGGALETVVPGVTGELFTEPTADALVDVPLERFDAESYDRERDQGARHALGRPPLPGRDRADRDPPAAA